MAGIPASCPGCKSTNAWKEVVKPLQTGIPVGNFLRIRFFSVRGLFSGPIKKKLGYNTVTYRCDRCGYQGDYELPD